MPTTQTIPIDLNTRGANPIAFTHQGDTARAFAFEVYNNGEAFTLSGYTAKIGAILPADKGYTVIAGSNMATGSISGNTITATLPAAYTAKAGHGILTIILTGSGGTLRPINIDLRIQKSADSDEVIEGASDFPEGLEDIAEQVFQEYLSTYLPPVAPSSSADANKAASAKLTGEALDDLKSDLNYLAEGQRTLEVSDLEQGTYNAQGATSSNPNRIRTKGFIDVRKGEAVSFEVGTNISGIFVGYFSTSGTFIRDGVWLGEKSLIQFDTDYKVILVFRKGNGAEAVAPSAYDATTVIMSKTETKLNAVNVSVEDLSEEIEQIKNSGLSNSLKQALLNCFENVAWINDQGRISYQALKGVFFPTEVYQDVEYITFDGNQRIVTDFSVVDSTFKILGKAMFAKPSDEMYICGISKASEAPAEVGTGSTDNRLFFYVPQTSASCAVSNLYNVPVSFEAEYVYITGKTLKTTIGGNETTGTNTATRAFNLGECFTIGSAGLSEQRFGFVGRVYECSFITGGIEHKFIPCYRIDDGVIGFRNEDYSEFYTNAGTGAFGKGGDL